MSATKRPQPGRRPALTPEQVAEARRLRSLPTPVRPRLADLAARFGVNRQTLRLALTGAPPYDAPGEPLPPRARSRDARYEREQAGVRVPLAQSPAHKAKHAQTVTVTAPWLVVRSGGRWARG